MAFRSSQTAPSRTPMSKGRTFTVAPLSTSPSARTTWRANSKYEWHSRQTVEFVLGLIRRGVLEPHGRQLCWSSEQRIAVINARPAPNVSYGVES